MEKLIIPVINFFLICMAGTLAVKKEKPADRYRWKNAEIALFLLAAWSSFLSVAWIVNHV